MGRLGHHSLKVNVRQHANAINLPKERIHLYSHCIDYVCLLKHVWSRQEPSEDEHS